MSKNQYLNYSKISKLSVEDGTIDVTCYHNGMYWMCPNPFTQNRAKFFKDEYEKGKYMSVVSFRLKETDFYDQENWDS
jgi:hypothetical protein